MKRLWIAFIVLATLGSIYPFNFHAPELGVETIGAFLRSCCGVPGRGDILGNVILFLPIGFTGMLAARPKGSVRRRFLFVCLVGVIVAAALQVMQIFLPSRDENLQDVIWNLFGTVGGAWLAGVSGAFSSQAAGARKNASLIPLTLIGTWLIYRLLPFVPSLDLQLVKDSLKPVLDLRLEPVGLIHDVTAWIVVAYLLRQVQRGVRLDSYLPVLMFAVFCLEVLIVGNSIDFSNLLGALLAALLWWAALRKIRQVEGTLVLLLLCTLAVMGFAPFDISPDPVPFNWLPFHGFLGGSMYLNTQSAVEKVFFYGSLVCLLWQTGIGRFGSVLIGFSFVAILEIAQTRFVGHTPEITDPLLVILAAIALLALETHEDETATKPRLGSNRHHEKWVIQAVNLREYQFDFLVRLSQEMGASVSKVVRQIIEQFIDGPEQDFVIESKPNTANLETGDGRERWTRQSINLRRYQSNFLDRLSKEMGISVSRLTRRIIAQFIDGLEEDDEPSADNTIGKSDTPVASPTP